MSANRPPSAKSAASAKETPSNHERLPRRAALLFGALGGEEMARANPIVSRTVFDCIDGAKEWYSIKGGHFGLLYYPSELFSEACAVQTSFLQRWMML